MASDPGFWLNPETGVYVSAYEHAAEIRKQATAKKLGLSDKVFKYINSLHWADEENRRKILLAAMGDGLIRVRRHGTAWTFEFTGRTENALWAVYLFLKKTEWAGPYSSITVSNVKSGEYNTMSFDTFASQMKEDPLLVLRECRRNSAVAKAVDFLLGEDAPVLEAMRLVNRVVEIQMFSDMFRFGYSLEEAAVRSMAHVYDAFKNILDTNMAILTAFLPGKYEGEALRKNRFRNQELLKGIRAMDWGFTPVLGGWTEDEKDADKKLTGNKVTYFEESFVVGSSSSAEEFERQILELLKEHSQTAAIVRFRDDPQVYLLYKDGHKEKKGEFQAVKFTEYWTAMLKGPPDRKFTFASGDYSKMAVETADDYSHRMRKFGRT